MAKKTGRLKVEALEVPAPQSRDEVAAAIAEIGRAQRERARIEASMNDDISARRALYEEQAKPLAARTKEDVDKDAILKDRGAVEGIAGIAISQREDFAVVPDETLLEEVR